MQNKKVTMLAAVLAVTVIAMAGVGYAAITNYTATTSNTDNSLETTYVVLKQSNVDANTKAAYADNFLTELYYNTITTAPSGTEVVTFIPRYTGFLNTTNGAYDPDAEEKPITPQEGVNYANAALVSKAFVLTVDPSEDDATQDGTLTVTTDAGLETEVFDFYMVLTENGNDYIAKYDEGSWIFKDLALTETAFTVQLYVQLADGVTLTKENYLTGLGTETSKCKFDFVFTVPVA